MASKWSTSSQGNGSSGSRLSVATDGTVNPPIGGKIPFEHAIFYSELMEFPPLRVIFFSELMEFPPLRVYFFA